MSVCMLPSGTLLHNILTAPPRSHPCYVAPQAPPAHGSHQCVDGLPESCVPCNWFYTSFVALSDAGVEALENATIAVRCALCGVYRDCVSLPQT